MRFSVRSRSAVSVALLISVGAFTSGAHASNSVSPSQQASLSSFYALPKSDNAKKPGSIIRSQRIALPGVSGARVWRVLYHSGSSRGKDVAVSGLVFTPKHSRFKHGIPTISWSHGTVGFASQCAPSRTDNAGGYLRLLKAYLRAGYAVAATDYEGVGTTAIHPYLIGASEGRNVIDIVKAARKLDHRLSNQWLAFGHSQGGHASLFAAEYAKRWGKGLKLRGVVAYAPASHLTLVPDIAPRTRGKGIYMMILAGLATQGNVPFSGLLGSDVINGLPLLKSECLSQATAAFNSMPPDQFVATDPAAVNSIKAMLAVNEPGTRKISYPVLLVQGIKDGTVPAFATEDLAMTMRSHGDKVTLAEYKQVTHLSVVEAGYGRTKRWLRGKIK